METAFAIKNGAYPTTLPCDTWDQYEHLRLERIKQQRKRMENMKDVVEQYSQIISQLEAKNKALTQQLEEKKNMEKHYHQTLSQNQELLANYRWATTELQREKKITSSLEMTIQQLKAQVLESTHQPSDTYKLSYGLSETALNRERDYQTLLALHSELKDEVYFLHKENIELKQVVRNQSKLYYERPENLEKFMPKKNERASEVGKIATYPSQNKPIGRSASIDTKDPDIERKYRRQNRELRRQLKQQIELVEKFKETQNQQIKLIDTLKTQKSRVCICHTHGSSKKIIDQKGNPTFKNLSKENSITSKP